MSKIETLILGAFLMLSIGLTIKVLSMLPSQAEIQQIILK